LLLLAAGCRPYEMGCDRWDATNLLLLMYVMGRRTAWAGGSPSLADFVAVSGAGRRDIRVVTMWRLKAK